MTTHYSLSKATDSLSRSTPLGLLSREGLGRRVEPVETVRSFQFLKAAAVSTEKAIEMMKLTKKQIEVTMFVCGIETLKRWKVG